MKDDLLRQVVAADRYAAMTGSWLEGTKTSLPYHLHNFTPGDRPLMAVAAQMVSAEILEQIEPNPAIRPLLRRAAGGKN